MFTQEDRTTYTILSRAAEEAERLGLGSYIIMVRRGGQVVRVNEADELESGDEYVGVAAEPKGGSGSGSGRVGVGNVGGEG